MTSSSLGSLGVAPTSGSSPVSSSSSTSASNSLSSLKPTDFINMMVTQLQNQDPLQPTSNQDLLAQMSQIGQLQSSTQLTTTLQGLTQQNQIAAGAALIGKTVTGLDATNQPVSGLVNSVSMAGGNVNLQLDSGQALPLANVATISPARGATTASGVTGAGASAKTTGS